MATRTLSDVDELTVVKMLAAGKDVQYVADATTIPLSVILHVSNQYAGNDGSWTERMARLRVAAEELQTGLDRKRRDELPRASGPARQVAPAPATPPRSANGQTPAPTGQSRPLRVVPTPATAPAAPPVTIAPEPMAAFDKIIDQGLASHAAKTRTLAGRIRDQLQQLRDTLQAETADRERLEREAKAREAALQEIASLEAQLAKARAKLGKPGAPRKRGNPNASAAATRLREVLERTGATRRELVDWAVLNGHKAGMSGLVSGQVLDEFEASRA